VGASLIHVDRWTDIMQVKGTYYDYAVLKNECLWEFFKLVPPYIAVSSLLSFCIFQALLGDYLKKNSFHECESSDS
jgi:hypothetical protein